MNLALLTPIEELGKDALPTLGWVAAGLASLLAVVLGWMADEGRDPNKPRIFWFGFLGGAMTAASSILQVLVSTQRLDLTAGQQTILVESGGFIGVIGFGFIVATTALASAEGHLRLRAGLISAIAFSVVSLTALLYAGVANNITLIIAGVAWICATCTLIWTAYRMLSSDTNAAARRLEEGEQASYAG